MQVPVTVDFCKFGQLELQVEDPAPPGPGPPPGQVPVTVTVSVKASPPDGSLSWQCAGDPGPSGHRLELEVRAPRARAGRRALPVTRSGRRSD
eukprot:120875-Rhodomonas_salina.3